MIEENLKIIVLQGAPGSGKSTWAREWCKDKKDWVIVSRDAIREGTGMYWCPEREGYISAVEEFQISTAIAHGLNVIIDATNLNPKTLQKWEQLLKKINSARALCKMSDVVIEYKHFDISLEEAIERDRHRERSVGENVIRGFFDRYQL